MVEIEGDAAAGFESLCCCCCCCCRRGSRCRDCYCWRQERQREKLRRPKRLKAADPVEAEDEAEHYDEDPVEEDEEDDGDFDAQWVETV